MSFVTTHTRSDCVKLENVLECSFVAGGLDRNREYRQKDRRKASLRKRLQRATYSLRFRRWLMLY